jgi:HD-GYP domain-containing protein (c-di-GMP phosphodiesterase class II)
MCRKIKRIIKNSNFSESQVIHPDISLGCMTRNDMSQSLESVIRGADTSMYRHKLLESRTIHGSVINIIKAAMSEKNYGTQEHAERMIRLTKAVGRRLGLTGELLEQVELLAMLHDVGKLSIDKKILDKQGELTEADWAEIKKHPVTGYRIAKALPQLENIAYYILCHHERWDGSGYPAGLKGSEIPLLSRIIAVADAYDAMTHDRAYRKARTKQYAAEEIKRNAGIQFDPEVVKAFLNTIE